MSAFPGISDVQCPYCAARASERCKTASGAALPRHAYHRARWGRLDSDRLDREFVVRINKTDNRLGVRKGEEYAAVAYWLDPGAKVTLLRRIPDGYNPSCNQYWHDADFIRWENA